MTPKRDERGSATIEAVMWAPVIAVFLAVTILGGRLAIAQQAVQAAATDAARSASIARTAGAASPRRLSSRTQWPGQPGTEVRPSHRVRGYQPVQPTSGHPRGRHGNDQLPRPHCRPELARDPGNHAGAGHADQPPGHLPRAVTP